MPRPSRSTSKTPSWPTSISLPLRYSWRSTTRSKVLGYIGQNKMLSPAGVKGLRTIKHCAMVIIGFAAGAELIIILSRNDDPQGGFFMGVLIAFVSTVVATAMSVLERTLQNAVDIKSEHDLTV